MTAKGQGARQRERANEMIAAMRRFEWDMHDTVARSGRMPPEWQRIWEARGAAKDRVTLRLDRDVLRFFRSMGDGYGPRMNAVLRAFMQARLAGLIEHGDLAEEYREAWMGRARPTPEAARREAEAAAAKVARAEVLLAKVAAGDGTRATLTASELAELRGLAAEFG